MEADSRINICQKYIIFIVICIVVHVYILAHFPLITEE